MKKFLATILALAMVFAFVAACADAPPPAPAEVAPAPEPAPEAPAPEAPAPAPEAPAPEAPAPEAHEDVAGPTWFDEADFPGAVAIVTNTIDQNEEEFRSAEALVGIFDSSRVIHRTWPVNFAGEAEMMVTILSEIAANPNVGAIVINQAVVNTNAAIDAARAIRVEQELPDLFIVVASAAEEPADVMLRADIALDVNNPVIGARIVEQAVAMGAENIIHYSFPRHMAVPMLYTRRDIMQAAAEAAGINFFDLSSPDPLEEGGMGASQLFISQDVPRQIAEHGTETVFFSTNCGQQIPLLQQVIEGGAMYVQPCCPSPFHAFPTALGLAAEGMTDAEVMRLFSPQEIIELTREAAAAAGMTGRLSNWSMPASMIWTTIGFMYAVEWLNGNAPQEVGVIDTNLLHNLVGEYTYFLLGERQYFSLSPLEIDGVTFDRFMVGVSDYLLY